MAVENIAKKIIMRRAHDILPNYVAGGMDATEGTYVWDHIRRSCPGEEWEELYKGKLGILRNEVITLDQLVGQRAWLKLGKAVTVCGRKMRSTHLRHVYVKWDGPQRTQGVTKKHPTPPEEKELENLRLEWSYQRGRSNYMIRRELRKAVAEGCWTQGTLMELRQSQAAGAEGSRSVAAHFGVGHIAVRSGGVVYVARCRMVVVELRNHTACTQEIPVIHQGKEMYVDPLSLVIRRSATLVKCRKKAPPRWKIGKEWFCGYPEIRPCSGPEPLPGHRRTNFQKRNASASPDFEKEVEEHQQGGRGQRGASRRQPPHRPPSPDPGRAQGPLQLMGPGDHPMQKLALMMAVMILGMSPAHGCSIGANSGSQEVGNQAVVTLPPSTWSGGGGKNLMTREKISSAAAEGSPPVEPGGHPVERILQQIRPGVEGLRMGQGTAKEDVEKRDIKHDSKEQDQGNGPESETEPKTAEALKKGADATRGRGQRKSRLYQRAGIRN
jgi:hypothetical protein